jgi:hypothetical protein
MEFPLSINALLDIGCPAIVISATLTEQLGLRRFPLPREEDNLTSLSQTPLECKEYVKLKIGSGKGAWSSQVFRAKVNVGLPVSLILGMPFLSSEHIVIDTQARTAIDKRVNHDLLNPPQLLREKRVPVIKPVPKQKTETPKVACKSQPTPALAGYLLPAPLMAAVRERIEELSYEEFLTQEDAKFKERFVDRFPLQLPETTNDLPNHIYHRIRLKDPHKITRSRGYTSAKKYHDAWKVLLEEHLTAGRIRPSSSEFASPAFCVPKIRKGLPDYTVPPRWVNDYRELNSNTVRDHFPLPRVDEILADCGKGKIFGKMDMTNSFFQTRVHQTTFI